MTPDDEEVLPFGPTPSAANTRTYTASVPAGTVVDIALAPTASVNIADNGTVTFDDTDSDYVADLGVTTATITYVNGVPGASTDGITSGGSITFTVTSTGPDAVVPVVWADASDDDDIDLAAPATANNMPKAPTDAVGVGGGTV